MPRSLVRVPECAVLRQVLISTFAGLTGSLGGELLAGGFASGGLACGLLGTGHSRWFFGM